jgi:acetyl esterase/lipase
MVSTEDIQQGRDKTAGGADRTGETDGFGQEIIGRDDSKAPACNGSIEKIHYGGSDQAHAFGYFYRPDTHSPCPVLIAVHGGSWRAGSPASYHELGQFFAERGVAFLSIAYSLASPSRSSFPDAIVDIWNAVGYVRKHCKVLNVNPTQTALMGDSAGAHLAALAVFAARTGLGGRDAGLDFQCATFIGICGVYDVAAAWEAQQSQRRENTVQMFLGGSLVEDRRRYFDASPISYVTHANADIGALIAYATHDEMIDNRDQSLRFIRSLQQAGNFVRALPLVGGTHFCISEPLDAPQSHALYAASRILLFLQRRWALLPAERALVGER